ncbi:MAG TPA: hypothetical protein VIP06_02955 [Nocardioides sp.]
MLALGAAGIAVLFLGAAFTLHFLKSAKKTVPWLMLLGGFGVAGIFGSLLLRLGGFAVGTSGSATRMLFGAAVPLLPVLVVGIILVVQMRPHGKGPNKATPWLALVFPSLLAALGGTIAATIGAAPDQVYAAVQTFLASLR